MNVLKQIGLVTTALVLSVGLVRADQWDKQTKITINEAVQLPTMTLQPGTYVFTLDRRPDPQGQIVRVWNADMTHQITMVFALPNSKLKQSGKTELSFWETPAGEPKALRAWFYPGDQWGQEFKYPKEKAERIEAYNKSQGEVPSVKENPKEESAEAKVTNAPAPPAPAVRTETQTAPPPPPIETARAVPPPAPEPVPQDNATQEQTRAAATSPQTAVAPETQSNETLPKTASDLPWIAFVGLVSLGLFAGTLVLRRALSR